MPIGIRSDANAGVTASAGPFGLHGAHCRAPAANRSLAAAL